MNSNNLFKKTLVFGIIVLFIGIGVIPTSGSALLKKSTISNSDGKTLYVGGSGEGNYSRIQDAIDNTSDGDTVFVFDESSPYFETYILIKKSINLIGENKDTTIIDGGGGGSIVVLGSDWINISGFTIQNCDLSGIGGRVDYCKITDNIIKNNEWVGVNLVGSYNNIISKNIITNNGNGIVLDNKSNKKTILDNNTINENIISYNGAGITLMWVQGNIVANNSIFGNERDGIDIYLGGGNIITNNHISLNQKGIWIFDTHNNTVFGNNIYNNSDAIAFTASSLNNIFNNNLSYNNRGITFGNSVKNIISGNTISNNHAEGIFFDYTSLNNKILNNTFLNNFVGLHISPSYNIDNEFSNNMFFNDGFFIESTSNTYSNNMVNGKPFVYLEGESNKIIDEDAGQIILVNCNFITVNNKNLSNTAIGIELYGSSNCLISENMIKNNSRNGIYITGSKNSICWNHIENSNDAIYMVGENNSVFQNNICKNSRGVFWYGQLNTIEKNNFILNDRDAYFHMDRYGGLKTKWDENYWGRSRIFPKVIRGIKDIFLFEDPWGNVFILPIPWIGFDKHPAQKPYDITTSLGCGIE